MPYISKEEVNHKRAQLKAWAKQNGFKLSITTQNYSTIAVAILAGPLDMMAASTRQDNGYYQVNHFYIDRNYEDYPEVRDVLNTIYNIMDEGNGILVHDGDYGAVPNFYTNLSVGKWDRPYVNTLETSKAA